MPSIRFLTHARYAQALAWGLCAGICQWRFQHAVVGVIWGGLLMALNLHAISFLVGRCHKGQRLSGLFAAAVGSKCVILMAGVVGIMQGFDPDLAGFALGLSTLFAGMAGGAVSMWGSGPHVSRAPARPTA